MFKTVEPYLEPIDIFEKLGERKSELSDENLGFICGLIKERRPGKIVEVGVSAGGTTCVILNCLEKLKLDSDVYSVDLSYTWHYDASKRCGYQIDNAKQYLGNVGKHRLFLGKNIAQVIDSEIGKGVDMLILDTIHYLPGELLDFLVSLPYLSQHAVIILDDLIFAHGGENTNAIATKTLFDLLVVDRVFPPNVIFPKMGGGIVNGDTMKYKSDYFLGLMTPWWYKPAEEELEDYRSIIKKRYGKEELQLFEEAVRINKQTLEKKGNIRGDIDRLLQVCRSGKKVLIYGAGQRGTALGSFLKERTNPPVGFVISDDRNKEDFRERDFPIYHLSEVVDEKEKYVFLVAVANGEVRQNLVNYNVDYIDVPNYIFPFIKEYANLLH